MCHDTVHIKYVLKYVNVDNVLVLFVLVDASKKEFKHSQNLSSSINCISAFSKRQEVDFDTRQHDRTLQLNYVLLFGDCTIYSQLVPRRSTLNFFGQYTP